MTQADRIVQLAQGMDSQLFTDQYGTPFIRIHLHNDRDRSYATYPLKAGAVRDWLAGLLWRAEDKAPGGDALSSALNVLKAIARGGLQATLYNRVAPDEKGGIYIDMGDSRWRAIHVTAEGWEIDDDPPIIFRRFSHQRALPEPVKGGTIEQLLQFANLKDPKHQLLYLVTTVTSFIPGIPHVVEIFSGPHGSGKTMAMRAQRAVTDPSIVELLSLPRDERELVQQLFHHYAAYYDNVSSLPRWASDVFCRAVTGTGVSKRELYTDDDVVYQYHRCCALDGINIAAERPDLLDRAVLLYCEMLDNSVRIEEKELNRMLQEATPRILGAILDILVEALRLYPTIELGKLFRMADYTRWGYAITKAMGLDPQLFLDAYEENVKAQSEETLKSSLIATVLVSYIEILHPSGWSGTPELLYNELCDYAGNQNINTRQKAWPKNANWMVRRFNEVAPNLLTKGITIETKGGPRRTISIGKTLKDGVNDVMSSSDLRKYSHDDNDDIDKISRSLPNADDGVPPELMSLTSLSSDEKPEICADCRQPIIDGSRARKLSVERKIKDLEACD